MEGFWENRAFLYSETSCAACPHGEADGHLQSKVQLRVGRNSFVFVPDLRIDTHHQVRRNRASYSDRLDQRSIFSANEIYLAVPLGPLDLRVGKQKIVWGRADGFNPTDNLTPFDYLDLVENERIGVNAVRARRYWGSASLDMVWIPVFTPTRLPLFLQRWFPVPDRSLLRGVSLESSVKHPAATMANSNFALRWDESRKGWDYSVSYFNGWNDIPDYSVQVKNPAPQAVRVDLARHFRRMQVIGGDFAGVLGGRAVRAEIAFFRPEKKMIPLSLGGPGNYLQYALGTDKRWGDWYGIVQWVGDSSLGDSHSGFILGQGVPRFPDRGYGQAILGRAEKTLTSWSSIHVNAAVRFRNADFLLKPEYLYDISQTWKLQVGVLILTGHRNVFLGQYRDNSRLYIKIKQSF